MSDFNFKEGIEFARRLDEQDPLKSYRERFVINENDVIYLDGNSLGRLPLQTREKLHHLIEYEWGTRLIRSWNEGWYEKPDKAARLIARLIGAKASEVTVCDSTSVNLFKLIIAALNFNAGRKKVVSDVLNFPTDLYVIQGVINESADDHTLELIPTRDGITIDFEDVERSIDEDTAVVVLSLVSFKSSFLYDLEKVTRVAHDKGALVIWDLSHAVGAVPVELNKAGADMAVGCTYKYLNGGPGSPAFLYINENLLSEVISPIWGWFGDEDPFSFRLDYKPAKGISKFKVGTPPVLSLAAIEPALNISLCAGIEKTRAKSIMQTEYLLFLVNKYLKGLGFEIGSPEAPEKRGSHITIKHKEGYRICKSLISPPDSGIKVIPDFREPDNIRLGIAPLYNSYEEIFTAVRRIEEITNEKLYEAYSVDREGVT
jgi:kynureninase